MRKVVGKRIEEASLLGDYCSGRGAEWQGINARRQLLNIGITKEPT